MFNDEIWKPVKDYEGVYEVSNHGRIRRLTTVKGYKAGSFLSGGTHKRGYVQICLCRNGTKKLILLHQIVADAFLGQCPIGYTVDHVDNDKRNNKVSNLEYVTRPENTLRQHRNGRAKYVRGEKNGLAKLKSSDIPKIRRLLSQHIPRKRIADEFGVTSGTISAIARGKTWTHIKD